MVVHSLSLTQTDTFSIVQESNDTLQVSFTSDENAQNIRIIWRGVIQRWLWENTSDEKSITTSYLVSEKILKFMRQICFAISLFTWMMSQLDNRNAIFTNFQYLTEWGVDLTVVYFGLALCSMNNLKFAEKYWKVAHVIFEIIYTAELIITAMFWGVIYSTIQREKTAYYLTLTTLEHGGMFLLLIADNIVNRAKFYKRHIIYLLAFVLSYLFVNLAVTLFHAPVYSIIDWQSKESHIFTSIVIFSTLLHFLCARFIYDIFKKKRVERPQTIDDFFFSNQPFQLQSFKKLLERKYVWWVLLAALISLVVSTFTLFGERK